MHYCSLICLFVISALTTVFGAANLCVDTKANSCGECISLPGCAWCEYPEYANNPNAVISRCDLPENLEFEGCPKGSIMNPTSTQNATQNKEHSNVGELDVGKATQIRPQLIKSKIRPGDPLTVRLSFKQAEDYPVDLYYLLDLSNSMENDLESLRALGQTLGESMQNITRDFRLGFGSFIDKTVMPFISTVPSKIDNPCSEAAPCVKTYSFHNDLPLTPEIEAFVNKVKDVTHSSNLDNPEGGLDAMMQAIVCQDQINWRKDATHLLVYSTDAGFHYAGDGKLGGIVLPNDGYCYLDNRGHYTKANEMDYPSIGHLVKKISKHNIQPIFAVTENVIQTYSNLQKMIPKSVVGQLTSDSSNIIDLIQDAYNALKGKVILEVSAPSGVTISDQTAYCSSGKADGLECDGVKIGDVVNFTLSISTDTCLTKPINVSVSPYGYNEEVIITLSPLCNCECTQDEAPNNCTGHGAYECGACVCNEGFTGLDCSCDQQDEAGIESYLVNCTDAKTGVVCSDRGECQCGSCICKQFADRKIDGKYCECDNTTCDRVYGKICNDLGKCNCGKCECKEGWTGNACECTLDESTCYDPNKDKNNDTKPCSGNGECMCGACECKTNTNGIKFRGQYCETSPGGACDIHRDCIQCWAFGTGTYNTSELCQDNCAKYNVTVLGDEGSAYQQECRFTDLSDDCVFNVYYAEVGDVIMVDVDKEKKCITSIDPTYIIIGIIAAIVGIGLAILLIWKLLTSIKDAREYKNFQKDAQNPKWQGGENPIFKKATSTFRNPMYTGGKPTANL
uniref:Integrin beta n=1 Tax=Phallusia mammillata TaxID=59560 RepID=A0A6F9DEV5_9ASCI|nr:integrin beta-1 [Phallusia mammillata]